MGPKSHVWGGKSVVGRTRPTIVCPTGRTRPADQSTDCFNYALTDCYHLIVIVNFKLLCSNLPHPAYQAKSREDESHEDNHGDYHADRHLLRGRGSICMIYDKSVVIIYDKKEFSIERMFRPSLVFPSTLWTSWGTLSSHHQVHL